MADEDASLSAGDWIGFVLAAVAVGGLLVFPFFTRPFEAMFMDFGAADQLPGLTKLALKPWFGPSLAVLPAAALGAALVSSFRRPWRRVAIVASFVTASLLLAACVAALYLPIVEVSGAIAR